ncbi:Serine/threonine-protein kinase PknB [Caulifigura coniformis]|uniref:non-specific serine/threonine protein kinase n=1 Tax=Caulifigura coniformis TaxID=2527983 RepID=A0A517SH70_9PLAN|nr:serine/threonine-protein kinase [Caulifigura coniformis]QDT55475.1 Serine/threonine-protein kinase PknB [Caulifigura coniformis]
MDPAKPEPDDAGQQRLFELLHRYVEGGCGGSGGSTEVLFPEEFQNAELSRLLDCLDGLNDLAHLARPRPASAASDSSLLRRKTLGHFDLVKELGRGAMGVVYQARHRTLKLDVALKTIRSSDLASVDEVRRFYLEARAAAGLIHPNITRVHDAGECEGLHYLTMDLIDGPSLAETLKKGPFTPAAAATFMEQVARAVHYLHEKGIVHRDIKPSNILIDSHGVPHVSDFGLAKVFSAGEDATLSGTIIGTPNYMSPEQAEGQSAQVTSLSDVFSLGAILYELLTGRPPFRSDGPLNTLFAVLETEPTLPRKIDRNIPPELERICLRCLEKSPGLRYASAGALADDLQRFADGEPITLPTTDLKHRVRQSLRREPALASHWLALALAAGIVQVRALLTPVDAASHATVMGLFGVWAALCWVLQYWLRTGWAQDVARYCWTAMDVVFYTVLLNLSVNWGWPVDMLLVGYAVMISGAGLWFQVRLIWWMTSLSVASYFVLRGLHPTMHGEAPAHFPFITAALLASVGANVSYQVHRFKRLDRIYQRRCLGTPENN